jgi:hypothetical protein
MFAEKVIAPGSAIPANNIDLAVEMTQSGQKVMQEVEFPDVIILLVTRTVVAKKMVQRRNAFRKVLITYPINNIEMFSGMKVIEAKPIGLGVF